LSGDQLNLYLALIHYPVYNRNGEVIASAVTNLDLHDISRAARTYGVRTFYVVTPLEDQQRLANTIVSYWVRGAGAVYNPTRKAALDLIKIKGSLDEVTEDIAQNGAGFPQTVATDARPYSGNISFDELSRMVMSSRPCLLLFGTAWGLSVEFIAKADYVLAPIRAGADYNHLSVRSAVAIVLDRLLGETIKV